MKFLQISPLVPVLPQGKDHAELDIVLDKIRTLITPSCDRSQTCDGEVRMRGTKPSMRVLELHSLFTELIPVLDVHLQLEENLITEEFCRAHFSLEELWKIHEDSHKMIHEFMDRKLSLVFIIYHSTDKEKEFFDSRLPFFIRWWMFPRWAKQT